MKAKYSVAIALAGTLLATPKAAPTRCAPCRCPGTWPQIIRYIAIRTESGFAF
jgi:hypothetical protein